MMVMKMSNMPTQSEILDIVTCMGYFILKNGGEISRAEDTVERIGKAYGMDAVHAFAIASSIVVTVEKGDTCLSQTRRVKNVSTNLHKLKKFNSLSRTICETTPSYDECSRKMLEIINMKEYSLWTIGLAYAIIGGSFSVFFGGGLAEFLVAFIIGAILKFVVFLSDTLKSTPFFTNVIGAATTVSLSYLASLVFGGLNTDIVTIGVLMNLVPGVLLANCIRDFVATDYMAGTAKIFEVLFIATAIALGVSVSLLWR